MCSELHTKIGKREETVCIVETLLVFTVAALHFAVVMWRVWADQFVPDPKARSGQFNASKPVFLVSREMVGKLNTIPYTTAFETGYHFLQKIGGGIGTLQAKTIRADAVSRPACAGGYESGTAEMPGKSGRTVISVYSD